MPKEEGEGVEEEEEEEEEEEGEEDDPLESILIGEDSDVGVVDDDVGVVDVGVEKSES